MSGVQRTLRGTAGAAALLLGITACGSDNSGADDFSSTKPGAGSIISDWENGCEVHDAEAIKEFMGITEFRAEPGEFDPGGGFSRDVKGCDVATFRIQWDRPVGSTGEVDPDDYLGGGMYLRVYYFDNERKFAERHDNAYAAWAESSIAGRHIVDERSLEGDWAEGKLFTGSDSLDELRPKRTVNAKVYDEGGWAISVDIGYVADPVHFYPNQQQPAYQFTDEELAGWVADTYIPQVYDAVVAAVEAKQG